MKQPSSFSRRRFVRRAGSAAIAVIAAGFSVPRLWAQPSRQFRPEQFGAKGDGRTDDTEAFQSLGRAVTDAGGGTIVLRPRAIYRVGRQVASGGRADFAFGAQPMLLIEKVNGLVIRGNNATLRLNDGLRYGSFDPVSGERFDPPRNQVTKRGIAAVVGKMIEVSDSSDIRISDLVLDGNMDRLVVGGEWGGAEIQLPATGLQLTRVSRVLVENIRSHDHGLDGVYLYGRNIAANGGPPDQILLRNVHCDRNGRQGMSIVGGKGLRFERCTFSNSGQGRVASRPKAGVDIEPNGRNWSTDATFVGCEFTNNRGVGLVADTGNSHTLAVLDCTFWHGFAASPGVTLNSGDALWLGREGVRIERCRVHGTVTHMPASAKIVQTSFDDDVHPKYGRAAQTRRYLLSNASGTFSNCSFAVVGGGRLGLIHARPAIVLRGCRLHFGGTGVPAGGAVAVFSAQTTLQDVSFSEAVGNSGGRLFIADNGATLVGKVTVSGPHVRWHKTDGPIGNIASAS